MVGKFNVNEYSSWIISRESPHNCLIVAKYQGRINLNQLQKAINIASETQEMLQYSISTKICGFILKEGDIPIYEFEANDSWERFGETELNTFFSEGKALARFTILRAKEFGYIMFCFHHIIGDGASGIQFLLDIIDLYNSGFMADIKSFKKKTNVPLNLWPEIRPPNILKPKKNIITKISSLLYDEQITSSLINHVKENGSTLNSFLSSQILLSMNEVFNNTFVNVCFPVDLRKTKYLCDGLKLKFFTSWISIFITGLQNKDGKKLCNLIKNEIKSQLNRREYFYNLKKLLDNINSRQNDSAYVNSFISTEPTICISYSGNIKKPYLDENYKLKLTEIHMSVSTQGYMGTPNSFTVQLTKLNNKKIFININYPFPLIQEDIIKKFLESLDKKITSCRKY